jgi:hypothetical protein
MEGSAVNVFVLSTGRCGSLSFARACEHMTNYTSAHESRWGRPGDDRLAYPPNHIESDNRLSWMLGRLAQRFGEEAFYVHLLRDPEAVAESHLRRWGTGIIDAFADEIAFVAPDIAEAQRRQVCLEYVETVNANIAAFIAHKPKAITIEIERAAEQFPEFWRRIGAEGDLDAAIAEFAVRHNATRPPVAEPALSHRALAKAARIVRSLPHYVANA